MAKKFYKSGVTAHVGRLGGTSEPCDCTPDHTAAVAGRCLYCGGLKPKEFIPPTPERNFTMGRRKKSEDGGQVTAVEKKRKAVKTKRIEREHAGKVVAPYAMLEKLIKKLHPDLDEAKFVLFWKKGWRPDADGVLTAAKIKKASEVDKELDDFDFAVFLNFELWNETKISEEHKTIVIDRELCHALPEIDRDGEQKKDDRGRLCWRLRKFEITEFVAIIHRYVLEKVTGINAELIGALDDEKSRKDAEAEQNDAQRPMLKDTEEKAEKPSEPATQGMYGWSPAYQAVLGLRLKYDELKTAKADAEKQAREAFAKSMDREVYSHSAEMIRNGVTEKSIYWPVNAFNAIIPFIRPQPAAPAVTPSEPTVYPKGIEHEDCDGWGCDECNGTGFVDSIEPTLRKKIINLTTQLSERDAKIAELTPLADNLKWAENNCDEIGIYATNDGDGNTVYCEYEGKMYGGKSIATAISAAMAGK